MNNLDSDIVQYIKNSAAAYHIEFYINQGFEVNKAIRRGWEEAYEELLEHSLREGGGAHHSERGGHKFNAIIK